MKSQSLLLASGLSYDESMPIPRQWLESKAIVFDFQCMTRPSWPEGEQPTTQWRWRHPPGQADRQASPATTELFSW